MTMKTRILVVDDEAAIHRFLTPALEASDYQVVSVTTGTDAVRRIAGAAPDGVILDLGLPDMDGKEVIAKVRAFSDVPIIVLSARDREAEKIEALDLGADDYVNKPFGIGELLARVRAAMRHRRGGAVEQSVFTVGPIEIDVPAHRATSAGADLKLTPKEFELLLLLARNAGKVMTHRQILAAVWGPAHVEDTQYLRVYVGQLRQKIEVDSAEPKLILTEPGIGYRMGE
ncbi:MAG: response regulator [Rhizobiales bacterium]|nr:response regulator [Hyphomicrobiales bacterium]